MAANNNIPNAAQSMQQQTGNTRLPRGVFYAHRSYTQLALAARTLAARPGLARQALSSRSSRLHHHHNPLNLH